MKRQGRCAVEGRMNARLGLLLTLTLATGALAGGERRLPAFSLRDPAGATHTRERIAQNGLVLVVTAPTAANEDVQRGWDEALRRARPQRARARLAFLEDLDQSWFPDEAIEAMREEYVAGGEPVLLLDRDGGVRRALGVAVDATVVLAFDAQGTLRHAEPAAPSAAGARRAWAAALSR
jgi:hypothetical protein